MTNTKKDDTKCLTAEQLFSLGNILAREYGLRAFTRSAVRELYAAPIPIPVVKNGGHVTLWLDRYYAAVETEDIPLRYVYLTQRHIAEERIGYSRAAVLRGNPAIKLPDCIQKQFRAAEKATPDGCTVWLDDEYKATLEVKQ